MLTEAERALLDQALDAPDNAVAQVLADALVEQGAVLGDFVHAVLAQDSRLARALLPRVLAALRDEGLRWADAVCFFRGLPVAATARGDRLLRLSDASSAQWPLEELQLEGSQVGTFDAALRLPLMRRLRRLALEGHVASPYSQFVDSAPAVQTPLAALRWLRPFAGEVPGHWRKVLLPAFAHVEVLNLPAQVDLETWVPALPRLQTLEFDSARPPPPELAQAAQRWARLRRLGLRFNGVAVPALGAELDALGLVTRQSDLPARTEPLAFDEAQGPAHEPTRFLRLDASGALIVLSTPVQGQDESRHWQRNLHAQLRQLPPLEGVLRPIAITSHRLVTAATLPGRVEPMHVTPDQSEARARWLHGRLLALLEAGLAVDAVTRDMLFLRDGQPVLFPVKDPQVSMDSPWRGTDRVLGLQLPGERVGSPLGVGQLVACVEAQWKTGRSLQPLAEGDLALRRAWRGVLGG